ncbi:hypothetical protein GCM10010156_38220 [Planobispora rosea]|uniref:Cellulose-binding protein n=2 Tax=Planobispora rosea TaxID=35762 RepID=A0A8J3RXM8_PLARO|nr:hypothetical protein GCM10010156_38220 [Planobispora rosea]GIH81897.1 hypothetical protein Pro02_03050 [Planobispora rosea]
MTNQHESFPDLMHEDSFEVVMRGYSRRQVHDYMIRTRNQIRDLEERVARAIDQAEQGRLELAEARRRLSEAPQDYDELGQRLSQILKLAEEEAAAKREVASAEAGKLREEAAADADRMLTSARERAEGILGSAQQEAERMLTSARERAEGILGSAQQEAERRVGEATANAEQMLAQAGNDAEEKLNAARTEADETLRSARAEAEATLTSARAEAEATLTSARAEAESTLTSAQQRAAVLDESTGRRVTYLTDTHREVMRRLNEMSTVLGDLIQREDVAGALIDEDAVLPPAPAQAAIAPAGTVVPPAPQRSPEVEAVRVIVEDDEDGAETPASGHPVATADDTDTDLEPVRHDDEEFAARK